MGQVYGTKVTRPTSGGLSSCRLFQVCYRHREMSGWEGRSQQRP